SQLGRDAHGRRAGTHHEGAVGGNLPGSCHLRRRAGIQSAGRRAARRARAQASGSALRCAPGAVSCRMAARRAYDYTVLGPGSAARAPGSGPTAEPPIRVLVLEAGGRDTHPLIHVPIGLGKIWEHRMFDWGYDTEPEPRLDNRRIEAMRGKVLGGSSSINVMA